MRNDDAVILIVDDTPINLNLLSHVLRSRNYHVQAMPSGPMALESAHHSPPDLIMLDIKMPEMDGYKVCQALKLDEKLREIPVIFTSALDDAWDKVKAFQVGGSDYVTKPFQAEEVLARVEHQIQLRRMRQQLIEHTRHLEQANIQLLEMDKMKQGFTSMLVHDLRSPLQCFKLVLDLYTEAACIPDGPLKAAEKALENMSKLINDLLEVFRGAGAELPLNCQRIKLPDILQQVFQTHQLLAEKRQIRMALELPQGLPEIQADPLLVERALGNLLGNALKYTPKNGLVRLRAVEANDYTLEHKKRWVVMQVEDTGRGILPEELPFVFDPFHQTMNEDKSLGVGLGLAIVQRIMAAHRGRATVKSLPGIGSSFALWFPLEETNAQID